MILKKRNSGVMSGPRRNLVVLIFVSLLLRLGWAAGLETGQDEAYHFLYTVHPDWSYFDHPPMLMYIARCGIAAFGGWIHPLSIRIGFVLLFAGSTWIMFRWTSRWYGESAGFYAALALNLSAYYTAAAGAFVLPDGPLLFFSLLTMWRLSEVFLCAANDGLDVGESGARCGGGRGGEFLGWVFVGFACAGAMLSKYHAVFLPLGALTYVVITPSARRHLLTPGPYVASAIGFLGLVPVLIWNSQHDWASFGFQSGRAMGGQFQVGGVAVMLFGPMAVLFPWIWYSLVEAAIGRIAWFRSNKGVERLLFCQSVLPIGLFAAISCTRPILPHWPLIGFLPWFPLLGAAWTTRAVTMPVYVHRWLIFMVSALLVIAAGFLMQARLGLVNFPFRDPCIEISGWESVGRELTERGIVDRPNTFLFTNHWFDSGQLAFAVRNRMPVACYRQGDARGFAFWSKPDDWLTKDGILIVADPKEDLVSTYEPYFREITPLEPITMTRGGRPFRTVRAYLCSEQLRPFPYTYERHPK